MRCNHRPTTLRLYTNTLHADVTDAGPRIGRCLVGVGIFIIIIGVTISVGHFVARLIALSLNEFLRVLVASLSFVACVLRVLNVC